MPVFSFQNSSRSEVSASETASYSLAQEADSSWGQPIDDRPTAERFLSRLLEMYWEGVYREVKQILVNLTVFEDIEATEIEKEYRRNGSITGYDAFIDQICEKPQVARRAETRQRQQRESQQPIHPLREKAPENGKVLREAVAQQLEAHQMDENPIHFRARCLLQSAGFLDIDKLIEYRDPVEQFNIWKRGKVPQLKVDHFKENGTPVLGPARCAVLSCRDILRGTFFRCTRTDCLTNPRLEAGDYVCEDCFHAGHHPRHHLVKVHKHCILDEIINQNISQKLCKCSEVSRFDPYGNYAKLYPIDPALKHRQAIGGSPKCGLFLLPGLVAEAKHRELVASLESRKAKLKDFRKRMRNQYAPVREPVFAIGAGLVENLDADVALPLRSGVSNFPFGNTHVALMVGPLIIENGYTKKGVLISQRDPFNYFDAADIDDRLSYCLALSEDRNVFGKNQKSRRERRLKACMKQVVGGAFSKFFNHELEAEIVSDLVAHSQFQQNSMASDVSQIHKGTKAVTEKLKRLLGSRIRLYLHKITARLFDPNVPLKWDPIGNNCQAFTDAILAYRDFGAPFGGIGASSAEPSYLLSFVVRKESYDRSRIVTKFDVPNGLTEEYILSFHSGRHDDSDIIDTLQEYWYDWGAFGGPLYKYQDHFPWDCTEAYKKEQPTCNDCTLARHVWAFPFDSWSIIVLSLYKERLWYPTKDGSISMTPVEWAENRFRLFIAQDALCRGAVAMARTPLRAASSWLEVSTEPQFDRLKLGGIHRAQPYSHHFEQGQFVQIYVAEWIHLTTEERVRRYEAIRNERKMRPDVLHYRSRGKIPPASNLAGVWASLDSLNLQTSSFGDPGAAYVYHDMSQGLAIVPGTDFTGMQAAGNAFFDFSGLMQFGGPGDGGFGGDGGGGGDSGGGGS